MMIPRAPDPVVDDVSGEAGFTLVELLVAFTLLGFISIGLFGGLSFGFKVWQDGNARADHGQDAVVTQNLLRQIVGGVYPFFVSDEPTRGHVDFAGAADTMEFLGTAPMALAHSGRLRFRLFADRRAGHVDLAMTAIPELADPHSRPVATARTLLKNMTAVEFSYFGQGRADKAPRWRPDWANELALPQLVRIRTAGTDVSAWPELTIAPRVSADVGCVYDPLNRRCQGR